jgi:perosamine synthetase
VTFRHLAPAGAPLSLADLWSGVRGAVRPRPAIEHLESELRAVLTVGHVFLTSSGRAGLTMILRALNRLSPRRQVIVPAYTCFSIPAAVHRAGLEVALCDIDSETFDYDYPALERLIAETEPLCVISTHLFGFAADVGRTRALCPRGVFVVDDAAQALGIATSAGPLGTQGDVGLYSFGRGKGVTCGAGGAVVTNSAEIAAELEAEYRAWKRPSLARALSGLGATATMSVFLHPRLYWLPASLPLLRLGETKYSTAFPLLRLSGAQAGLLQDWRKRLLRANELRTEGVTALRRAISVTAPPGTPACIRFPLVCASRDARDRLYTAAKRKRLGFSPMYPTAVSGIPEVRAALNGQRFPQAEQLAERLLTVPVHPLVSERDRQTIRDLLAEVAAATEHAR